MSWGMCGPLHPPNNNLVLAFAYRLQACEFLEGVCTGVRSRERLLISKPHRQGLRFGGFFVSCGLLDNLSSEEHAAQFSSCQLTLEGK